MNGDINESQDSCADRIRQLEAENADLRARLAATVTDWQNPQPANPGVVKAAVKLMATALRARARRLGK